MTYDEYSLFLLGSESYRKDDQMDILTTAHLNVSLWESEGFILFSTNSPRFQARWNPLLSDEANFPFMTDENGIKSLDE